MASLRKLFSSGDQYNFRSYNHSHRPYYSLGSMSTVVIKKQQCFL